MGLFTLSLAGGGLMLIGAWEVLSSSYAYLQSFSSPPLSPPYQITTPITKTIKTPFFSSIRFIAIALFSFCFIFDCLISLNDALNTKDGVGFALQLEIISIASLFLLYSVFGLLVNFTNSVPLPSSFLSLIALVAFGQEFIHFYLQRKDPNGLENRYFDLLLVPITICIFSTVFELGSFKSNWPRLSRGVGLILHGTWFVQMGFSFYSNSIAQGCVLHEKSRGNFTVMCKGHAHIHRSKGIVTLQFNCHLAFLVILIVGVYSVVANKYGLGNDYSNYKPLNEELRQLNRQTQFTLDDDDDDDDEIAVEENVTKSKDVGMGPESGINGFGDH